jgi:hypothetical protein
MIAVTMDRRREAHHGHAHAAGRQPERCTFRGDSVRTARIRIGRVFFSTDAALREEPGRGGDDEGSAGTGERGAKRLDRELVGFAGSGDVREVVNEGRVDDAIRDCRSTSQAVGVLERPPVPSAPAAASDLAAASERARPST